MKMKKIEIIWKIENSWKNLKNFENLKKPEKTWKNLKKLKKYEKSWKLLKELEKSELLTTGRGPRRAKTPANFIFPAKISAKKKSFIFPAKTPAKMKKKISFQIIKMKSFWFTFQILIQVLNKFRNYASETIADIFFITTCNG